MNIDVEFVAVQNFRKTPNYSSLVTLATSSLQSYLNFPSDADSKFLALKNSEFTLNYYYLLKYINTFCSFSPLIFENVFIPQESKSQFDEISRKIKDLSENTSSIQDICSFCQFVTQNFSNIFLSSDFDKFKKYSLSIVLTIKKTINSYITQLQNELISDNILEIQSQIAMILKQTIIAPTLTSVTNLCQLLAQFNELIKSSLPNIPASSKSNIMHIADLSENFLVAILFYKTILVALHFGILFSALTFTRNSDEINYFISYKCEFGDNELIFYDYPKKGKIKIPNSFFSEENYNKFVSLFNGLIELDNKKSHNNLSDYFQQYKPLLKNVSDNTLQVVSELLEKIIKYVNTFDLTPYMAKFHYNLQKLRKMIAFLMNLIKLEILSKEDRVVNEIFRFYMNAISISLGNSTMDVLSTVLESSNRLFAFSCVLKSKNLIISEIISIITEISQILAPVVTILDSILSINDYISFNSLKISPIKYIFPNFIQTPYIQRTKALSPTINHYSTQIIREICLEIESFGIQIFSSPEKMMATGIIIPDLNKVLTESHLLLRNLSFRFKKLRYYYNSIFMIPMNIDKIIKLIKILNLISINNPEEFPEEILKLTTLMNILFQIHQLFICLDVFDISNYYNSVTITHLCFLLNMLKKSDKNQKKSLLVREDLIEFITKKVKSIFDELFTHNFVENIKSTSNFIMDPIKLLHIYLTDQRNPECLGICCETIYDLITNKNPIDNLETLLKNDISDDYRSIIEDLRAVLSDSRAINSNSEFLKYLSGVSSDLTKIDPNIVISQTKEHSFSDLTLKIGEFKTIYEIMKDKRLLLVSDDELFNTDNFTDRFIQFFKKIKLEKISKILKKILGIVKEIDPLYKLTKTILIGGLTRENVFQYFSLLSRNEIQISDDFRDVFAEEFEKLYIITNFVYAHDEIIDIIMKEKQNNLHLLMSLNQDLIIDYFATNMMFLHSAGFFNENSGKLIFDKIIEVKTDTNRGESIQLIHVFDQVLSSEGWRINSIFSRALKVVHAVLNTNNEIYIKLNELFEQFKTPEDLETVNKIIDEIQSSNLAEEQKEYILTNIKLMKSYSLLVTLRKHLEIVNNSIILKNKIDDMLIDDLYPSISVSKLNLPRPQLKVPISKLNFSQQSTIASIYENLKEERNSMLQDVVKLIEVQNIAQSKTKILNELKEKRKKLSGEVLNLYNDLEQIRLSNAGFSMNQYEIPDMKSQIENAKSIILQQELDKRSDILTFQSNVIYRDNLFLKSLVMQKMEKSDNNTIIDSFYKKNKTKTDEDVTRKDFGTLLDIIKNDNDYEALRNALIRKGVMPQ